MASRHGKGSQHGNDIRARRKEKNAGQGRVGQDRVGQSLPAAYFKVNVRFAANAAKCQILFILRETASCLTKTSPLLELQIHVRAICSICFVLQRSFRSGVSERVQLSNFWRNVHYYRWYWFNTFAISVALVRAIGFSPERTASHMRVNDHFSFYS